MLKTILIILAIILALIIVPFMIMMFPFFVVGHFSSDEQQIKCMKRILGYDFGKSFKIGFQSCRLFHDTMFFYVLQFEDDESWANLLKYCESLQTSEDRIRKVKHYSEPFLYEPRKDNSYAFKVARVQETPDIKQLYHINFQLTEKTYANDQDLVESNYATIFIDYQERTLFFYNY